MTTAPSIIHLLDPEEPVIDVACCGCASRRDDLADDPNKVTCHDCLRTLLGKWRPMVDAASARLDELTCAGSEFKP